MSNFQDFKPAAVAAARLVLRDGREFVFAASEGAEGLRFKPVDGGPSMTSLDLEDLQEFQKIDAEGRVVESIRRAAEPLQS